MGTVQSGVYGGIRQVPTREFCIQETIAGGQRQIVDRQPGDLQLCALGPRAAGIEGLEDTEARRRTTGRGAKGLNLQILIMSVEYGEVRAHAPRDLQLRANFDTVGHLRPQRGRLGYARRGRRETSTLDSLGGRYIQVQRLGPL